MSPLRLIGESAGAAIAVHGFVGGFDVGSSVQADAQFLRRIFFSLVLLTLATGVMAVLATGQAMTELSGSCSSSCG